MYKATEINNNASDFKVGDTVRFYLPFDKDFRTMTSCYIVGTGTIVKATISKETEPGHFGHGSVKGPTFGKTVFEIETERTMCLGKDTGLHSTTTLPYRMWKQKVYVAMDMPFGGLAK